MNALLTIAATPPPDTEGLGRGLAMVLALALLGIAFVGAVAFGAAIRRARRLRADAANRRDTVRTDAWAEAGKRVEPADAEVDPEGPTQA